MQGWHSNKDQAVRSDGLMNAFEKTEIVFNMFNNIKQANGRRTFGPNNVRGPHTLNDMLDATLPGVQHALLAGFNKYGCDTSILKSLRHKAVSATDIKEGARWAKT
jgi:hypothetical protein